MSPYQQKRRKTLILGGLFVLLGVMGWILPIIPGTLLILVGLSLLSLYSGKARKLFVFIEAKFPKAREGLEALETYLARFFDIATFTREYTTAVMKDGRGISVLVDIPTFPSRGTAVLVHSAVGTKDTPFMDMLAEVCVARGLTVVRFDAFHGLGKSEGEFATLTATSLLADLEDVVLWAQSQMWWRGHLSLWGHSVGGLVAGLFAEAHPNEVQELVLFAPMISGASYLEALEQTERDVVKMWRDTGSRVVEHPIHGEQFGLSYSFVEDVLQYDLLPQAKTLSMPVFVFVGDTDLISREHESRRFTEAVGKDAHCVLVRGVGHIPKEKEELMRTQEVLHQTVL